MRKLAFAMVAALGLPGAATAGVITSVPVDLSGLESNEFQGSPINDTITITGFNVGDVIMSVDFDVNMTGVALSYFEEATYSLWDGEVGGGLAADGSNGDLSYSPGSQDPLFVDEQAAGSHDFADYVMTSDTLIVDLHEWGFNDVVGGADAIYNADSSLTINYEVVPAPAGVALLGIAAWGAGRRRRRS